MWPKHVGGLLVIATGLRGSTTFSINSCSPGHTVLFFGNKHFSYSWRNCVWCVHYITDKWLQMEGGVWNVRPALGNTMLVSCMYGGWALLDKVTLEILKKNTTLGADLLYDTVYSSHASSIVSCTFNNYQVNFEKMIL